MTQNIDRPRHRRSDAEADAGFAMTGGGRPMVTGYGTPPAGYGVPQYGAQQYGGQQYGGQQYGAQQSAAPRHGAQQFGAQQFGAQQFGAQQFVPQQYGAPQFAPQQHGAPQPPSSVPPQQSNGIATAGLVVAIIGAVFSFIPVIGTVAWVLAPIGLALSAVGLVKSRRAQNGRGKSIAGIVLSVVALIMCVLYTAVFAASVSNVQQQSTAVHTVTYKVTTARGTHITASYNQSQNDNLATASVADTASPWSANAQVSGFIGPNVTASLSPDIDHLGRSDTITCSIVEDGVQVAQNSATGPNASVSCTK